MKSPKQLRHRLIRDWGVTSMRVERLLDGVFPIELNIGKPSAQSIANDTATVRKHIGQWKDVKEGQIEYIKVNYRATGEAITVPNKWVIQDAHEWLRATKDEEIQDEMHRIIKALNSSSSLYHEIIVRKKHLWKKLSTNNLAKIIEVVGLLEQDCCKGIPLRAFSVAGIDTKFFEGYRTAIIHLLDAKFDNKVSAMGLETFLGAINESAHWVLLADLDGDILPFRSMRVQTSELLSNFCSAQHILIVENEQCLYTLPAMQNTIVVLGAGLDLTWTEADWLQQANVAYWGDIDTWGLVMLSQVRENIPSVTPLLMTKEIFQQYCHTSAVVEKAPAPEANVKNLKPQELELFSYLKQQLKGRLEQEFINKQDVHSCVKQWRY